MAIRGKRILSGIQPSGAVHIGNYFGAIRQWIQLQEENEAAYFLADYHSMTTMRDAAERRAATFDMALAYLCLGVDAKRSILYRQSDVPEVNELAWCLSSVTPMALLERAHAYKDKLASGAKPDHGLFAYPVLMAADILIHKADYVPVGGDQKQHVELTRDMAQKFNQTYGEVFVLPEPFIPEGAAFVPGTDGRKMSKTYGNAIEIFAPEKKLRKQVMGVVTDSTPVEDPKPLDQTLIHYWDAIGSEDERAEIREACERGGVGYGDMKKRLAGRLIEFFAEARERREALAADPDRVEDILADGARRAREGAAPLLEAMREAAGIGPPKK
jgi:tryptophanyl-tRNA synthetase